MTHDSMVMCGSQVGKVSVEKQFLVLQPLVLWGVKQCSHVAQFLNLVCLVCVRPTPVVSSRFLCHSVIWHRTRQSEGFKLHTHPRRLWILLLNCQHTYTVHTPCHASLLLWTRCWTAVYTTVPVTTFAVLKVSHSVEIVCWLNFHHRTQTGQQHQHTVKVNMCQPRSCTWDQTRCLQCVAMCWQTWICAGASTCVARVFTHWSMGRDVHLWWWLVTFCQSLFYRLPFRSLWSFCAAPFRPM